MIPNNNHSYCHVKLKSTRHITETVQPYTWGVLTKTKCSQVTTGQKELLTEMYRQASALKAVVKLFVWRLHVSLLHLPLIPQNRRTGLNVVICTALSIQKIKLYTLCAQSIEMSIMVSHPVKDSILI